ncbi:hypothetical protein INT45_013469 [Circinella minor]|uniref:Uncharacterized protein n=1 Tax=Circinella minor TaxID=1195481 RepID=A0A8H7RQV5_9FUNG|nr:hypothetical protein INT45_013469 [Circinella minor]
MDKTLSDYDQSLEELERQREHLELVMKTMGQEWEESGAGIGWMQLQQTTSNSNESDIVIPNEQEQEEEVIVEKINDQKRNSEPFEKETLLQESIQTSSSSSNEQCVDELRDRYPPTPISPETQQNKNLDNGLHVIIEPKEQSKSTHESSLHLLMQQATPSSSNGPSADYLQSLLNVNEALLAQSLTDSTPPSSNHSQDYQLLQESNNNNNNNNTTTTTTTTITTTKEELPFMNKFPIDNATTSILSPPITPEESYSTIRASCLSRKNSLIKSTVRPSTSSSSSSSASFQQYP